MVGPNELLYFADICAGPGGFSEYVLWRKGWQAKGFGFTLKGTSWLCALLSLHVQYVFWIRTYKNSNPWICNFFFKGDNDFKLEEFLAGTPETFEPHYGKNKSKNKIKSLVQMLLSFCLAKTSHFWKTKFNLCFIVKFSIKIFPVHLEINPLGGHLLELGVMLWSYFTHCLQFN